MDDASNLLMLGYAAVETFRAHTLITLHRDIVATTTREGHRPHRQDNSLLIFSHENEARP
jgi:hypothetical protein